MQSKTKYRINISRHTFEDGRRVALMVLSARSESHVRLYCDLDARFQRRQGPLWGTVTLWNACWSQGNQGVSIDQLDCEDIVREALGSLDFSLAAQTARRAVLQQKAA